MKARTGGPTAVVHTVSKELTMHPPPRTRRILVAVRILLVMTLVGILGLIGVGSAATTSARGGDLGEARPTIVLVHGSFADASGFNAVIQRLHELGYTTIAPPNPLRGLPADAAYIRSFLDTIEGPIVLAAHSYGGMVITNAATGNPNVKALVYINGFAPAEGEVAADLVTKFPGSMIIPENLTIRPYPTTDPAASGLEAYINTDVFREAFAADIDRRTTAAMAAMQRPIDLAVLQQPSGPPAWETIPAWFIIGKNDNTIPADLHRFMAERAGAVRTVELRASHALMISKPAAVVDVIIEAARYQP
jgi:pimeloyl-ACP methyl ester carboxylesterase